MTHEERNKKNKEIRDFRYMLIGELANPHLPHGKVKKMIADKAEKKYDIPYSNKTVIGEATIKQWLNRYKKYGYDALMPTTRKDYRKTKVLTDREQEEVLTYIEQHPDLTAKACVKILYEKGIISNQISRSSLSRFLQAACLDRKNRNQDTTHRLKFNFEYPMECVQVDCMHAFTVPDDKGKKRKAILILFLDDATRRILYARFSFSEASLAFEAGIKQILLTHGRIGKLYTDNGSTFVAAQSQRILNILGIVLTHSKPGVPQGRGKVERIFRTIRDQFIRPLDKDEVTGLENLNARFMTWVETEYHRNPHRGLNGKTPLEAWMAKTKYIIELDPSLDLDTVFLHEAQRKVYQDTTITLHGNLYEVPSVLIGKTVTLFYNPATPQWNMTVWYQGKQYGTAKPVYSYANTKVKRNMQTKELECVEDAELKKESTDTPPVWLTASKLGGTQ